MGTIKIDLVYEFLDIDIKILDNGEFQFYQTGLIHKVLKNTGMDDFNGLPTHIKVEEHLGTYNNGYESMRYYLNLYYFITGMIFI